MGLVKAELQAINEKGQNIGKPVKVLFNPSEYTIEKSNQFQSTSIPGLSTPITQFANGNSQTLTMDLFFDTYEENRDVRDFTSQITGLLDINSELHAPPICKFMWGRLEFKATLERVSQKFTMFQESGIPVRATLSVTFKEYRTITEQFKNVPRHSSDRTKKRIVKQGESLYQMADQEYGDPGQWRVIAKANKIYNPRILTTGKELTLPPLE